MAEVALTPAEREMVRCLAAQMYVGEELLLGIAVDLKRGEQEVTEDVLLGELLTFSDGM
jgi:hypothetical protein